MCCEAKPKYASYPDVDQDLRNSYREQRTKKKNFNRTLLKNGRSVRVAEKRKSDEEMAKMYMRNITDFCKGQGIPYVDNNFPDPDAPDGGRDDVEWLRVKDIKLGKYQGMVVHDESSSKQNVLQGELADCWFSTALASIGGRHELLKRIFLSTEVSPEGFYFLRLCKDGAWKTVLIDDRLPCDRRKHTLKYSTSHIDKNGNVQLWPMLIQKAAAKLHGSYMALSSGIVVEALSMLTGEACDHIVLTEFEDKKQIPKVEPKDIWSRMLQAKSEMFLMGVTTAHEKRNVTGFQETGLIAEHAYSVLDVCEIEGQQGRSGTEDFNDLLIVVAQNSLTEDRAPYVKQPLFKRVIGHSQRRARSFVSCDCVLGEGSYTVACLGFWQLQYDPLQKDNESITFDKDSFSRVRINCACVCSLLPLDATKKSIHA
ncbi:hypothetical protein FSP39_002373 [Pinctada imbricata]|uniref:Calpain catalytic domain-containing protein n=1 Tax=Pinctada imbricata TaxID=66713 RepID=A0AA89C307_PINIB|nr:hypothetical protein FSP39_002373 [Pinctada imbricata]